MVCKAPLAPLGKRNVQTLVRTFDPRQCSRELIAQTLISASIQPRAGYDDRKAVTNSDRTVNKTNPSLKVAANDV